MHTTKTATTLTIAETVGPNATVSMIWYCGGHGTCLTLTPDQLAEQNELLLDNTIAWLNNKLLESDGYPHDYVSVRKFQFVDQNGTWYAADVLPIDCAFYAGSEPVVTEGSGGLLAIVPIRLHQRLEREGLATDAGPGCG